ncbi:hypothetical protein B0H11DRAFT_2036868 [Mycena galericulata]|nr:hypothetical protein B0H11DRAFT_2036868 [Mycena galericulata]
MISVPSSLNPSTLNVILLASPPPPFPVSSFISSAFCFFLRNSSGGRTALQSPLLSSDGTNTVLPRVTFQGGISERKSTSSLGSPPVLPLGSEQSLLRSTQKNCVKSPRLEELLQRSEENRNAVQSSTHATGSPIIHYPPPSRRSPTAIKSKVFSPTILSEMHLTKPCPPTPEIYWPGSPTQRTPIYQPPSPVFPTDSDRRALRRPTPRRPRTFTAGVEVKSPVLEYHPSDGTTPYDRHGWDPMVSFNASRGSRKPFRTSHSHTAPASPVFAPLCRCWDCLERAPWCADNAVGDAEEEDAPCPKLPWLREQVHTAPYTRLPCSPALPSCVPRSPRPENHHRQVNRYKSEVVRRKLMRLEFKEPRWAGGDVPIVRTPEEMMERRRRRLEREESVAETERRWRWRLTP